MKRFVLLIWSMACLLSWQPSRADSIWERRDPRTSHLFMDTRARQVGDLLTIVIRENTVFDGKEDRKLRKDTRTGSVFKLDMNYKAGEQTERNFEGNFDALSTSERRLEGKADYKSDRTFTDRVTVRVMAVMPNGNLVIEGYRRRIVQDEERMLLITGIVRPIDIMENNMVQSQWVGNLTVSYIGQGAESSYLKNGWLGRIMNVLWPF